MIFNIHIHNIFIKLKIYKIINKFIIHIFLPVTQSLPDFL